MKNIIFGIFTTLAIAIIGRIIFYFIIVFIEKIFTRYFIKPNYKKVVPGLGMIKNGQTGNLIIEMSIEFPDSLTKEQIDAIRDIL